MSEASEYDYDIGENERRKTMGTTIRDIQSKADKEAVHDFSGTVTRTFPATTGKFPRQDIYVTDANGEEIKVAVFKPKGDLKALEGLPVSMSAKNGKGCNVNIYNGKVSLSVEHDNITMLEKQPGAPPQEYRASGKDDLIVRQVAAKCVAEIESKDGSVDSTTRAYLFYQYYDLIMGNIDRPTEAPKEETMKEPF